MMDLGEEGTLKWAITVVRGEVENSVYDKHLTLESGVVIRVCYLCQKGPSLNCSQLEIGTQKLLEQIDTRV